MAVPKLTDNQGAPHPTNVIELAEKARAFQSHQAPQVSNCVSSLKDIGEEMLQKDQLFAGSVLVMSELLAKFADDLNEFLYDVLECSESRVAPTKAARAKTNQSGKEVRHDASRTERG